VGNGRRGHARVASKFVDCTEGAVSLDGVSDRLGVVFAQALHQAHAEAEGRGRATFACAPRCVFQCAVPVAVVDVEGADLDPVLPGIADDLGGGVEPHGRGVDERGGEGGGMVALEPCGGVDEVREARGVRLRKAVLAEPLDLLEASLGEAAVVAVGEHAVHQPLAEPLQDVALALPCGHGAAELVGLVGREARGDDRQLHRLLLKQRHAQRLAQHALDLLIRIRHRLLPGAAAQVGMNHFPLDRPGADDRHLDHQVVILPRPQPRQHRHLRPRLHLENTNGVGPAQHVVHEGVFGGDGVKIEGRSDEGSQASF